MRTRARSGRGGSTPASSTPAELDRRLALIEPATGYDDFGDVDLVIEAVPERLELKQAVFSELDEVTPGQAILASNTSALSITEIGEATTRADRVVGLHFFYPASVDAGRRGRRGRIHLRRDPPGARPRSCRRSANSRSAAVRRPGFIVNRILNACVSRDLALPAGDAAPGSTRSTARSSEGTAAPIGPFMLCDKVGTRHRHERRRVPRRRPTASASSSIPACRSSSQRGELGVKTGKGLL